MEINIEDYLSHDKIKSILEDELRFQVSNHFKDEENTKRLLINLSYDIVKEELNKIVPDYQTELINKVSKLINEKDLTFHLFYKDEFNSGKGKSLACKLIDETVNNNKEIIKNRTIETILKYKYDDMVLDNMSKTLETLMGNFYDLFDMMKNSNINNKLHTKKEIQDYIIKNLNNIIQKYDSEFTLMYDEKYSGYYIKHTFDNIPREFFADVDSILNSLEKKYNYDELYILLPESYIVPNIEILKLK